MSTCEFETFFLIKQDGSSAVRSEVDRNHHITRASPCAMFPTKKEDDDEEQGKIKIKIRIKITIEKHVPKY